jgi:AcrR family transcriptional regulator
LEVDVNIEIGRPNGPRSRKGVRTRARLLEAAKEIFEESGLLEARISDIAERAGLSHGSFYHYFESKEEIFREVAEAQEVRLSTESIIESGLLDGSVESIRERLAESIRRFLAEYRDQARIMAVIEQVSRYDEQVGQARFRRYQEYIRQVAESIKQMQRAGLADPDLDPMVAAVALGAMVTRLAESWFVQGHIDCSFEEGVEQLTKLCMNAQRLGAPTRKPRSVR